MSAQAPESEVTVTYHDGRVNTATVDSASVLALRVESAPVYCVAMYEGGPDGATATVDIPAPGN